MKEWLLFDVFELAFEEFVEAAEVEEPCSLAEEVGGFDSVDLIEHGVVVDGELLEDGDEEVVGVAGVAEGVVVDDAVAFADVEPE